MPIIDLIALSVVIGPLLTGLILLLSYRDQGRGNGSDIPTQKRKDS